MKSFQKQFKECSMSGYVNYYKENKEEWLNKDLLVEGKIKIALCLRFGGQCHSKNEKCLDLRLLSS